ncbi:MAG: cobalamin-dependent protein [Phycisphaerae bacterium]|nr:cobalamin-dependent protein [Phycisphaerae bacterium]
MRQESTFTGLFEQYMEPLVEGRRQTCRSLVLDALRSGGEPTRIYHEVLWPAMERVDRLYREDRISTAIQNMAARINRVVADQIQSFLPIQPSNGKRILITCAAGEQEELGAQMCADLFESNGWDVYFLGGGVPNDEILSLVGQLRPDILMIFGSRPQDAPVARQLIDEIRAIDAVPQMNILVSGGVFNRAAGLWKEVRADLFAETAVEALDLASTAPPRTAERRSPNAPKKRRRRRRPPLLVQPGEED